MSNPSDPVKHKGFTGQRFGYIKTASILELAGAKVSVLIVTMSLTPHILLNLRLLAGMLIQVITDCHFNIFRGREHR